MVFQSMPEARPDTDKFTPLVLAIIFLSIQFSSARPPRTASHRPGFRQDLTRTARARRPSLSWRDRRVF
jgi:hypothetical protein